MNYTNIVNVEINKFQRTEELQKDIIKRKKKTLHQVRFNII